MRLGRLANAMVSATLSVTMAFGLLPGVAFASNQVGDPTAMSMVVEEEVSPTLANPVRMPSQDPAQEHALDYELVEVEGVETPSSDPGAEPDGAGQAPAFAEQFEYEGPAPEPAPEADAQQSEEAAAPDAPRSVKVEDLTLSGAAHIQGKGWV